MLRQQAFADASVLRGRSTRNVLHRALDELDLLSLQLRADVNNSNDSGTSTQAHQYESQQSALRSSSRSQPTIIRNVCDRFGLSPPSSPSPSRRADANQGGSISSRRAIIQGGKLPGGRSLALALDLEMGLRRRVCAKTLSSSRYQRVTVDSCSKYAQPSTSQCVQPNVETVYTPMADRRSRKRIERCKRLRKPYEMPWRAQKSATLNTLYSDGVRRGDAADCASHARRVSAPSVLDTDDECTTPTQTPAAARGVHSTLETLGTPTPTGFAATGVQGGAFRFGERESLMLADTAESSETQTESSGVHSIGLLSTTVPVCGTFPTYANSSYEPNAADCFGSSRSQSNSVDSKSPVVSVSHQHSTFAYLCGVQQCCVMIQIATRRPMKNGLFKICSNERNCELRLLNTHSVAQ